MTKYSGSTFELFCLLIFIVQATSVKVYAQEIPNITDSGILQTLFGNHYKSEIADNHIVLGKDSTKRGVYSIWKSPPDQISKTFSPQGESVEYISKVAQKSFFPGKKDKMLVEIFTNIPRNDCHLCSPAISLAIFNGNTNGWELQKFYEFIGFFGEYGLPYLIGDLFTIGKNKVGIPIDQWVTGQGYFKQQISIFSEINKNMKKILTIDALENNSGYCVGITTLADTKKRLGLFSNDTELVNEAKNDTYRLLCSGICWGYVTRYGLVESSHDWFDIITVKTGTVLNYTNNTCELQTFTDKSSVYTFSTPANKYQKIK